MTPRHWRFVLSIMTLALTLLAVQSVGAHAKLKSSEPADQAVLAQSPAQVRLTFTEETSPTKSEGSVVNASGEMMSTGFTVDLNDRTQMRIAMRPNAPSGAYTVRWKTVTEDDNGTAEGAFAFTVGAAMANGTPGTTTVARTPTVIFDNPSTRVPTFSPGIAITPTTTVLSPVGGGGGSSRPPLALILVLGIVVIAIAGGAIALSRRRPSA